MAFRVLDPACGSGNFLYIAVQALQDIEHLVGIEAEAMGLQRAFARVGPQAVRGIEINPFAAELARVSVWIGHIQWARRNAVPPPHDPVLRTLDTIECQDAVLAPDGTPAEWPPVDVIVGNPPFLGDKMMRGVMGDVETEQLRGAYKGRVPGGADLVCYWFEQARTSLLSDRALRVGLVATQSIRNGASRKVLDAILSTCHIFDAWSDEPWTVDGAAVRVSLVCFQIAIDSAVILDGRPVTHISSSLSGSISDLTLALAQLENKNVCFQGPVKVGGFDIDGKTARRLINEPKNPHNKSNSDVVRPWANGEDITDRHSDWWIIDFGALSERDAQLYIDPFAYVVQNVKPARSVNRDKSRRENYWQLGRSGRHLRTAIERMSRFIGTSRVSKHRTFVWLSAAVLPDSRVYAICREDDTSLGVLHSRFHESWSLKLSSRHGVGNDPTYNSGTCFETFPFPENLTPNIPAETYANNPNAIAIATAARALVQARDRWLNPADLIDYVPDILPHLPHRYVPRNAEAALKLKSRTLTNLYNTRGKPEGAWLDSLHADLDAAVAAAYGWPPAISEPEALAARLALNLARATP